MSLRTYAVWLIVFSSVFLSTTTQAKEVSAKKRNKQEMKFSFPALGVIQTVKVSIKNNDGVTGAKIIRAFNKLRKSLDLEPLSHYYLEFHGAKVLPATLYENVNFPAKVNVFEDALPVALKNLPQKMHDAISKLQREIETIKTTARHDAEGYQNMIDNPDLATHGEKTIKHMQQMYNEIAQKLSECSQLLKKIDTK